jgi:pimeloyl-ACP methyl ester carboxylesterase
VGAAARVRIRCVVVTDVLVPPWPAADVSLPDRTLSVRHATNGGPDAEPAVMLHGLGGSSLNWTDLMAAMGDRLDAYAPDLNGFGASPPPRDGDYTPAGHARGTAALIEHLGIGPVHLFGNSMGGAVALQLAARRPDLIRTMTLISPALPTLRARRTNAHLPVIAIPGIGERLVARYQGRLDAETRARATIDFCAFDARRIPEQRVREEVEQVRARDHLPYVTDAFLASLRGLMATYWDTGRDRPWRLAERVAAPTLVVYGREDPLVDSRAATRVTRHFRDAHVVVVPDSGHVAQMEHPELVSQAWRTFLGRRTGTTV